MTKIVSTDDFACKCSEEGRAEIAEVRAWAEEHYKITDTAELINRIIYSIMMDYHAIIDTIAADMWGGISAGTLPFYEKGVEHPIKSEKQIEGHHVFIQCDSFFDGFLYVAKSFYDKYGDKAMWSEYD